MTIVVGMILIISLVGFQIPLICSAMDARKLDELCTQTLKRAARLKSGNAMRAAFHRSVDAQTL